MDEALTLFEDLRSAKTADERHYRCGARPVGFVIAPHCCRRSQSPQNARHASCVNSKHASVCEPSAAMCRRLRRRVDSGRGGGAVHATCCVCAVNSCPAFWRMSLCISPQRRAEGAVCGGSHGRGGGTLSGGLRRRLLLQHPVGACSIFNFAFRLKRAIEFMHLMNYLII